MPSPNVSPRLMILEQIIQDSGKKGGWDGINCINQKAAMMHVCGGSFGLRRAGLPNFAGKAHLYSEPSCCEVTHGCVGSAVMKRYKIFILRRIQVMGLGIFLHQLDYGK